MGDIAYWDEEYAEKVAALQKNVKDVYKVHGQEREKAIRACEKSIQQLNSTTKRTFSMEMRQLGRESKKPYQLKLTEYERQVDEMKRELQKAQRELDEAHSRDDLFGDRAEKGEMAQPSERVSRDDLLKAASSVQDKTAESLQRTMISINETNDIGDATLQKMAEQTEQIKRIDDNVQNIDSELDKASLILKSFIKRAMTDRLLGCIVVLVMLAVLGLIIYMAVK